MATFLSLAACYTTRYRFLLSVCLVGALSQGVLSKTAKQDWPTGTKCHKAKGVTESCICDPGNNGTWLDLSPLASPNGLPMFTNLSDHKGFVYNYNPCNGFYQGGVNPIECKDVHICRSLVNDSQSTTDIAADGSEEIWIEDSGKPYVYYTGPENRKIKVILHCDQSVKKPFVSTTGETDVSGHYMFEVKSCQACIGGCG